MRKYDLSNSLLVYLIGTTHIRMFLTRMGASRKAGNTSRASIVRLKISFSGEAERDSWSKILNTGLKRLLIDIGINGKMRISANICDEMN